MLLEDHGGASEVVVRGQENRSTRVRLFDPVGKSDDELSFDLEVQAD